MRRFQQILPPSIFSFWQGNALGHFDFGFGAAFAFFIARPELAAVFPMSFSSALASSSL